MDVVSQSVPPAYGRVDVGNNVFLHYQRYASKEARPCFVLLHSLAMDHSFWRLVAPRLASHGSVICLDIRGHGKSDKPSGPYSINLFARDAARVAKALGHDKVIAAGASMGGCIALQLAIDYPDLVRGLGLIDTTAFYGQTAPQDWAERAAKAQAEGLPSLFGFQATRWFSDSFRAEHDNILENCMDIFVRNDLSAYTATCNALGSFDARDGLKGLDLPTAIVVGEQDMATTPAMAEDLHKAIKSSSLTVIPGARHLTPLETPETIVDVLLDLAHRANQ